MNKRIALFLVAALAAAMAALFVWAESRRTPDGQIALDAYREANSASDAGRQALRSAAARHLDEHTRQVLSALACDLALSTTAPARRTGPGSLPVRSLADQEGYDAKRTVRYMLSL